MRRWDPRRAPAGVYRGAVGFGGATVPGSGSPIPSHLLLGELVRLGPDFTVLRRSFWRDVARRHPAEAVGSILTAVAATESRDDAGVARDLAALTAAIGGRLPAAT